MTVSKVGFSRSVDEEVRHGDPGDISNFSLESFLKTVGEPLVQEMVKERRELNQNATKLASEERLCQDCDEPILSQRLLAKPFTKVCRRCQEKRDLRNPMIPKSVSRRDIES